MTTPPAQASPPAEALQNDVRSVLAGLDSARARTVRKIAVRHARAPFEQLVETARRSRREAATLVMEADLLLHLAEVARGHAEALDGIAKRTCRAVMTGRPDDAVRLGLEANAAAAAQHRAKA